MIFLNLDDEKRIFLNNEFLTLSVSGALQRVPTYRSEKPETHEKLGERLRELLNGYADEYMKSDKMVSDEIHYGNIQKLANTLSKECKEDLKEEGFRIGSAQKALNLYLKYLWCAGRICTPPHCPFDNKVLQELEIPEKWPELNDIEKYKRWVEKAKKKADNRSLSDWELRLWNKK